MVFVCLCKKLNVEWLNVEWLNVEWSEFLTASMLFLHSTTD